MRRLFAFLALFLAGCGDHLVPVRLTPGERAWVTAYRPGQHLTFRSNRGTANNLTAFLTESHYPPDGGDEVELRQNLFVMVTLHLESATDYGGTNGTSFCLQAYKVAPDRPAQLTFNLAGLSCQSADSSDTSHSQLIKLVATPITLVNGRRYPAAYMVRRGQYAKAPPGSQLQAFWWDQQAGLLRYELANGEVFDRAD